MVTNRRFMIENGLRQNTMQNYYKNNKSTTQFVTIILRHVNNIIYVTRKHQL